MAGQPIIDWLTGFLTQIIPDPLLWGLLVTITIGAYLVRKKAPLSAISHLIFLLILSLTLVLGGIFEIFRSILYAVAGAVFFLGLWQFIGKR